MNRVTLLFVTAILSLAFFAACKKNSPSISSELIGNWAYVRYAYDLNNNKYPDTNEWYKFNVATSNTGSLTFRSDNSGYRFRQNGTQIDTFSFYWSVGGNSILLNKLDATQLYLTVDTINSHQLVLIDTTGGNTLWVSMSK